MKHKNILLTTIAIFSIAMHTLAQTIPSYVPSSGLIGWWPFTGNTNNALGTGINGINYGATLTSDRFLSASSSYSFNGTSSRIELPTLFNYDQRSINVWFQLAQTYTTVAQTVFGNDNELLTFGHSIISISPTTNSLVINVGGTVSSNTVASLGTWYMCTITRDNSNCKFYLNSNLIYQGAISNYSSGSSTTQSVTIGCTRLIDRFFKGKIDDIGLWNRALTQAEITNLYNGTVTSINEVNEKELVSAFPNPVSDHINITTETSLLGSTYTIYDHTGKVVSSEKIITENTSIDLKMLSSGIYLINVGGGTKQTFKFIKE